MAEAIPQGRGGVIPHLVCSECAKALDFYAEALGAEVHCRMPSPDGRIMHAEMSVAGAVVMLADDYSEQCEGSARSPKALGGSSVGLHVYVEDCDAAVDRAAKAGAKVLMPAQDMFWGDRYGVVIDPFGHQWSFATHIADLTPEQIAEGAAACFAQG